MISSDNWDVIIVGGGPAGCATAIMVARFGLRVLLLEAHSGARFRPGETFHPGIEAILRQLKVLEAVEAANFLRHEGIRVNWGQGWQFQPYGEDKSGIWRGFQGIRREFDQILLKQAQAEGVTIHQPCVAKAPIMAGQRIVGVKTSQGCYYGRFLVDASGNKRWLSKQLGLTIQAYSRQLRAVYGYVTVADTETNHCDRLPCLAADDQGWTWVAPLNESLYTWTRLNVFGEQVDFNWLPPVLCDLSIQKSSRMTADVTWTKVNTLAGRGFFIVGDAATLLDPLSSHGVLKALMSGIQVAFYLFKISTRQIHEGVCINAYHDWLNHWFFQDLDALKLLYAQSGLSGLELD